MQIIILAAGRGSRMEHLTENTNKCLLELNGVSFLARIITQLSACRPERVVLVVGYQADKVRAVAEASPLSIEVVENDRWARDTNIYSMHLALERVSAEQPTLLMDGDCYLDSGAMQALVTETACGDSIWFTCGPFRPEHKAGGIIESPGAGYGAGPVSRVIMTRAYDEQYANWSKFLGFMTIGPNELTLFRSLVAEYQARTMQQYWLIPWIENLERLPCRAVDLSEHTVESVNTPVQLAALAERLRAAGQ